MGLGYAAVDRPAYPSGTLGRSGALQGLGASQVRQEAVHRQYPSGLGSEQKPQKGNAVVTRGLQAGMFKTTEGKSSLGNILRKPEECGLWAGTWHGRRDPQAKACGSAVAHYICRFTALLSETDSIKTDPRRSGAVTAAAPCGDIHHHTTPHFRVGRGSEARPRLL